MHVLKTHRETVDKGMKEFVYTKAVRVLSFSLLFCFVLFCLCVCMCMFIEKVILFSFVLGGGQ